MCRSYCQLLANMYKTLLPKFYYLKHSIVFLLKLIQLAVLADVQCKWREDFACSRYLHRSQLKVFISRYSNHLGRGLLVLRMIYSLNQYQERVFNHCSLLSKCIKPTASRLLVLEWLVCTSTRCRIGCKCIDVIE